MTKISDEELKAFKEKRQRVISITENLSEMLLQKIVLDDMIEKTKNEFLKSVSDEERLLSELNKKYGKGLLDIETGEIKTSQGE